MQKNSNQNACSLTKDILASLISVNLVNLCKGRLHRSFSFCFIHLSYIVSLHNLLKKSFWRISDHSSRSIPERSEGWKGDGYVWKVRFFWPTFPAEDCELPGRNSRLPKGRRLHSFRMWKSKRSCSESNEAPLSLFLCWLIYNTL